MTFQPLQTSGLTIRIWFNFTAMSHSSSSNICQSEITSICEEEKKNTAIIFLLRPNYLISWSMPLLKLSDGWFFILFFLRMMFGLKLLTSFSILKTLTKVTRLYFLVLWRFCFSVSAEMCGIAGFETAWGAQFMQTEI